MSANPQPRPLVTGDLDLLISRSLDGDLPLEEERELKALLAADPTARARYDAMARLVGRLDLSPVDENFALNGDVVEVLNMKPEEKALVDDALIATHDTLAQMEKSMLTVTPSAPNKATL